MDRMVSSRHGALLALALVVTAVAGACGTPGGEGSVASSASSSPRSGPSSTTTTEAPPSGRIQAPPLVTVQGAGGPTGLEAWTFCYRTGCADGLAPDTPPDVGDTEQVEVSFPLDDWSFEADFVEAGVDCARHQSVPLRRREDGSFLVLPAGRAGTYDVTLAGRSARHDPGDLFVTFRWTTRSDGPLPTPDARTAVLADHNGVLDSYGVELFLTNLAATPVDATATITVRSTDGVERTLTPARSTGCQGEGSVAWNGSLDQGKEVAAALGRGPYTYEVEVNLDGVVHRATATWPDDELADGGPSVPLTFDPPLPALS